MVENEHSGDGGPRTQRVLKRLRTTLDEFASPVRDDPPGLDVNAVSPVSTRSVHTSRVIMAAAAAMVVVGGGVALTVIRGGSGDAPSDSPPVTDTATSTTPRVQASVLLLTQPSPSEYGMFALTGGFVGVVDGCVVLEDDDGNPAQLPIWPHGATWNDAGYIELPDGEAVPLGHFVLLGGGYLPVDQAAAEPNEIERCLPPTVSEPWLVDDVEITGEQPPSDWLR